MLMPLMPLLSARHDATIAAAICCCYERHAADAAVAARSVPRRVYMFAALCAATPLLMPLMPLICQRQRCYAR